MFWLMKEEGDLFIFVYFLSFGCLPVFNAKSLGE